MTIDIILEKLRELETPFYYYDLDVLRSTLEVIKKESAGTFGKYIELPETRRGDLIAIKSAGAYGEAMASRNNLRDLPKALFSGDI